MRAPEQLVHRPLQIGEGDLFGPASPHQNDVETGLQPIQAKAARFAQTTFDPVALCGLAESLADGEAETTHRPGSRKDVEDEQRAYERAPSRIDLPKIPAVAETLRSGQHITWIRDDTLT